MNCFKVNVRIAKKLCCNLSQELLVICSLLGECWEEEEEYTERLFILGLVHHPLSHILITHGLLFPTHCATAEKFFSAHWHRAENQWEVPLPHSL
jgi:hypothetical protein